MTNSKKFSNVFSAILEIKMSNISAIQIQMHPDEDHLKTKNKQLMSKK